jgi:hypothetical protein
LLGLKKGTKLHALLLGRACSVFTGAPFDQTRRASLSSFTLTDALGEAALKLRALFNLEV